MIMNVVIIFIFCFVCSIGDTLVNITTNGSHMNMDTKMAEAGFQKDGKYVAYNNIVEADVHVVHMPYL
jgi:MoaA/NifB/PqqE/SkfB family radical SAM enzyme